MFRFINYLFLLIFFIVFLVAAAGMGGLYYLVVKAPCPEMNEGYIESILGRESPVYYRDGKEKIGVLFQDIHRQYVTYDHIPKNFVNAITAAEDDRFFSHYGIDIRGIVRAMIVNYKAGRIVQGGSTITQQTAKNLFKRKSRSYKAKLKELLYALRLEYRYPKEKILEFYANQFYVSGNGHGLGVAARYYFNKEPDDLSLLEAAFIAGSVKRPNYYNPFTKKNKKDARRALARADERAAYVLGKMLKLGMISRVQYDAAIERDIVFNRGKTSFALNTVMDLVKDGLASPVISEALEEHGISNIATSGARIISSVDYALQTDTLYSLRRDLSRLDVRLRGYSREMVQQEYAVLKYRGDGEIRVKAFLFGTISAINKENIDKPIITVQFGPKQPDGIVDRQGLSRMVDALVKYRKNRWSEAGKKDFVELLSRLQVGDRVYVSVREVDIFDGAPTLDLERYPKLQGAALVMQQGMIRAMAGGMENRFYNRAVSAKRLMGSTFKPFMFSAALQLGWSPVDLLDNRRDVFVFMDRPYFPRPDHHSPFDFVSMSWAGVKSENVAAVWLLYHLTDQLTLPRLQEVAAYLDMAPRTRKGKTESYQSFKERIRDRFGIRMSRSILDRAAYEQAIKNLEADFLFEDHAGDYSTLKSLPYGLHFDKYREVIVDELENPDPADAELKPWERKEFKLRLSILRYNYLDLLNVRQALHRYRTYFDTRMLQLRDPLTYFDTQANVRPEGRFIQDDQGRIGYTLVDREPDHWQVLNELELRRRLQGMAARELDSFFGNVLLDGRIRSSILGQVQRQVELERASLSSRKPYSLEVLAAVSDYRVMLGLQYLIQLGHQAGITSKLEPVLSFPLGSNVVSLIETVRMYETLVMGNSLDIVPARNNSPQMELSEDDQNGLAIIERIEGPGGEVIYSSQRTSRPLLDRKTSSEVSNILQDVVLYGTGRYAGNTVRLHSENSDREHELEQMDLPLPMLGKTGTANDFRNASFVGYVPVGVASEGAALTLLPGYTVGVYVGYDSNEPMKKGSTHITGAQGALPAWSAIAGKIFEFESIADKLDPVDLVFNGIGLKYPDTGQLFVPIDFKAGGRVIEGRGARHSLIPPETPVVLSYGQVTANGHFEPERSFRPFWVNQ